MERGRRQTKMDHVQCKKWTCTICKTDGNNHLQRKGTKKTKINIKRSLLLCLSLNTLHRQHIKQMFFDHLKKKTCPPHSPKKQLADFNEMNWG